LPYYLSNHETNCIILQNSFCKHCCHTYNHTYFFGHRDKSLTELKTKYAKAPSAFINVDSIDVHYRDEGNTKDSLPIVLLHGTGASLHTYDAWVAVLKNERRVVRMDLPAFGLTGPFPDDNYSIENYIDFIHRFLSTKGITKCILAGNSLGGQIAYRFTIAHPLMVDKLILIDAASYPVESKSVPIAFRMARIPILNKAIKYITPRFMVKASVENVYADKIKVTDTLVDRYFDLALRAGNREALVDRMTFVYDTSTIPLIKNIQQRTLILWGEQDLLIPTKSAYRFHDDLPNDTMVILKNLGHVPMEEGAVESFKVVLEFLKD
jgi:pimeloyl-ACP methyl ester carboxylesterase